MNTANENYEALSFRLMQGKWKLFILLYTGALAMLCVTVPWHSLLADSILALILIISGILDYYYGYLYDRLSLLLAITAVVFNADLQVDLWSGLMGSLLAIMLMQFIRAVSREGLGLGDVKFSGAIGWWLGFPDILAALGAAFLLGGLAAMYLLFTSNKGEQHRIAFGPFLAGGVLLAVSFGDIFLCWYGKLL